MPTSTQMPAAWCAQLRAHLATRAQPADKLAPGVPAKPPPLAGPAQPSSVPPAPRLGLENAPAEKHVCLPEPPAERGPWTVGPWTLRRTTTYEPAARVVLTGPAADFERLLAHLKTLPTDEAA